MIPVFYASPEQARGETVVLARGESQHATKVLRSSVGDMVMVVDGLGTARRGTISAVKRSGVEITVHAVLRNWGEPGVRLTLAAGLSAGTKFDSVVQRGTEIGVTRFVPILTELSKVKLEDPRRARARVTRLERVARSAIKQCRRSYCPEIATPVSFDDFLAQTDREATNLAFHVDEAAVSLSAINLSGDIRRVTALVGPESGFTQDEIDLARKAGFVLVRLGDRILRTETAAPVIAALIMEKLSEFS